ncbi:hypothetical protein LGH70_20715 [Hymenobacter sp. BT635]|uniref:Glycosyltransferase RgtA/B/C/D-like domain-containing protein n=1 Tax=Hymenobacter nitidus TaxID=2880929 RepID=A0ABS8AKK2_9BACT|nr:hypothetical protein [Hymenobacter nitidus]MCB2380029.1 hypothetical protein [Hymenobacter nitidus]
MPLWFTRRRSLLLVFLLAMALLWSNAYFVLVNHPAAYTIDERSYLQMAQGNFDVPVTHRYRVVLPLVAGALARSISGVTSLISPSNTPPIGSSFFLLNVLLLSLAGLLLYRTARAHGAAAGPALIGMAAVVCSGTASYISGLVLVDSAVVLAVAALCYAVRVKAAGLLLAVIVLGPVLKESFLLFLPVALLYGRFVPLWQRLLALLGAAGLVVALHAAVDAYTPAAAVGSVANALEHGRNILSNLKWLLSPRGLFICGGVFGLFNLVLLAGFWGGRTAIRSWLGLLQPGPTLLVLAAVLAHMLLSGEMSRMLLLAGPVVATAVALILDRHPLFAPLRQLLGASAKPDSDLPASGRNP